MVYGYLRVSTDSQTVENQRYEINKFAMSKGLEVKKFIEETISGSKEIKKRKLGKLLKILKKGDVLIASEISRLGRSLYMVMDILNICMEKQIFVYTIKDNFHLGDDIESKVLAFAFSLSAEIERKLISQRTKEALERIKKEGIKLGRPIGSKNTHSKVLDKMEEIKTLYAQKMPISQIAKRTKLHQNTIYHLRLKEKALFSALTKDRGI